MKCRLFKIFILFLTTSISFRYVDGQERCTEAVIRVKSAQPVPQIASDDIYFNTGNSVHPISGRTELEQLRKAHSEERRNQQPVRFLPQSIVILSSGEMAYDFGQAHVEYDVTKTGQHVSFDIEYLRVWKMVGESCRLAASFSRPVAPDVDKE